MASVRAQWTMRRGQAGFEAAAHAGQPDMFLSISARVGNEAFERIVTRVNCPDDFVQYARAALGLAGNLLNVGLDPFGGRGLALGELTQQADLRQARTQLIMDVAGDARPFLRDALFHLEMLDLALQLALLEETNRAANRYQKHDRSADPERPGLPKVRRHDQGDRRAGLVPKPIVIASDDAKAITARRSQRIQCRARCVGLAPIEVDTIESVFKPYLRGSDETGRRIAKLDYAPAWPDGQNGATRREFAVHQHVFDDHRRRFGAELDRGGRQCHRTFGQRKPQSSIPAAGNRRLRAAGTFARGQPVSPIE